MIASHTNEVNTIEVEASTPREAYTELIRQRGVDSVYELSGDGLKTTFTHAESLSWKGSDFLQ